MKVHQIVEEKVILAEVFSLKENVNRFLWTDIFKTLCKMGVLVIDLFKIVHVLYDFFLIVNFKEKCTLKFVNV